MNEIQNIESVVKPKDMHGHDILSKVMLLNEITEILYQVNDLDTALDMILDTCTEYLKLEKIGIITEDKNSGVFSIFKHRFFKNDFADKLRFKYGDSLNSQEISATDPTHIAIMDGMIKLKSGTAINAGELTSIHFFPVIFHDKLLGFLVMAGVDIPDHGRNEIHKLIKIVSVQVAPVMFSFDAVCRSDRRAENIISKIIRDRMYEAQLVLSPISFSLFRIIPIGNFEHSLPLEEAINDYRKLFSSRLDDLGDTIWLTPDTIFFIFPKADLFKTESLCANLSQEISKHFSGSDSEFSLMSKYVCLGYPQSGKDSDEIIRNLWLKLFEEMSELNSGNVVSGHKVLSEYGRK